MAKSADGQAIHCTKAGCGSAGWSKMIAAISYVQARGGIFAADPHTGGAQCVLDTIDGQPINGINEIAADGHGGLYFGTIDLDAVLAGRTPGAGQLFHFAADSAVSCVYPQVGFANGMALSADGSTLYLNESFDGTYAFDVAPGGGLSNRRRILVKPDCDGMALDCEGNACACDHANSVWRR
jgi:sugar lactone lactonase YvrE